jgi:hypothetical protein
MMERYKGKSSAAYSGRLRLFPIHDWFRFVNFSMMKKRVNICSR